MNPTQKNLLAQMQINSVEIARRKELLDFTQRDVDLLASCRDFIQHEVQAIVGQFYETQTSVDEIALIIGDADSLSRLRAAMTRYTIDLFSGFYDEEYVNNRLRIGLVHKRIGVAPKYYLSAMRVLKAILFDSISKNRQGHPDLPATLQSLDKLLYLDNEFVFDTYIRSLLAEIESTKDQVVRYASSLEEQVLLRTAELEELSRRDPLTGLYNQRFLAESLRRELSRAKRNEQPVALVYFDVDGFKHINDTLGHLAGDEVLRNVGTMLTALIRSYDLSFRYGGDEFCVVLPDTDLLGARDFAHRLQERARAQTPSVQVSIGIALTEPPGYENATDLLSVADRRMYCAKAAGGGIVVDTDLPGP